MKQKYIITNLVYDEPYTEIFLNLHLKSLLDQTNLPSVSRIFDIQYKIFTDEETAKVLELHPQILQLTKYVNVEICRFAWGKSVNAKFKFDARYSTLMQVFRASVDMAIKEDAWLTAWVADLVVAKEFFPRILNRMSEGHGAVFMLPLRSAYEPMKDILKEHVGALDDHRLCRYGFENLHPLWLACHWNAERFTKLPFSLIWTNRNGIMARSFSITPIVFKPKQEMLEGRGMIDGDVPALCDNPYWATDWTDAPVIGVEPLFCYYPTFTTHAANTRMVRDWAHKVLHPTQIPFIERELFYPSKEVVRLGWFKRFKAARVAKGISK